jgi:ubiquinone/menaquinone biosynthesis C-methylase UbiE
MALISRAEARDLLVCPRCHSRLVCEPGGAACSAPGCPLAAPESFPLVDGQLVVVDFEDSVVSKAALLHARQRTRRPGRVPNWLRVRVMTGLRRIWKPPNRMAARGVARLLAELPPGSLVLVVGGGTVGNGTEALYDRPDVRVLSFDIYPSTLVQFLADAHKIPLPSGSVAAVVVQAVLEHVLDPRRVVAEIHRVLGQDGLVYAETPFMQQVHAGAHDFTRFTASGHRWLFRGFAELSSGAVAGPGTALLWSIDHLARALTHSQLAGRLARVPLLWVRSLDKLADERAGIDGASAVFFLGRRSENEMTPGEAVAYYRGAQHGGLASH